MERLRGLSLSVQVFHSIEACARVTPTLLLVHVACASTLESCCRAALRYAGKVVVVSDDPALEAEAFDRGAYDFFAWPRDLNRLFQRTRATFARAFQPVYMQRRVLMLDQVAVRLTTCEAAVLRVLLDANGEFVATAEIAQCLGQLARQSGNVRFHVLHLRRKLGPHAGRLQTEAGLGYRFVVI